MKDYSSYLQKLTEKYGVAYNPGIRFTCGQKACGQDCGEEVPLQPWRSDRRFVELARLVSSNTIEDVCQLRFLHHSTAAKSIDEILYEECDLLEFIGQGAIASVHAVMTSGHACNVIVKLDNGIIGSVEVTDLLPNGAKDTVRHEIVARRGVANDLPIDIQLQQESVYVFTKNGNDGYRDVDFELYGLDEDEICIVRAEYEFFSTGAKAEEYRKRHAHLQNVVEGIKASDKDRKRVDFK